MLTSQHAGFRGERLGPTSEVGGPFYHRPFSVDPFDHEALTRHGGGFPRTSRAPFDGSSEGETWSFAPHAATVAMHTEAWDDTHQILEDPRSKPGLKSELPVKISAVRTVCANQIETFSNATTSVWIPHIPEWAIWTQANDTVGSFESVQLEQPLWAPSESMPTKDGNRTVVWIQPDHGMRAVTAGMIILGPLIENASKRLGVVCSIDARWNDAHQLVLSLFNNQKLSPGFHQYSIDTPADYPSVSSRLLNDFKPIDDGHWQHISAESSWLENVFPTLSLNALYQNPTQTQFEDSKMFATVDKLTSADVFLRENKSIAKRTMHDLETTVSLLVADAISRIGTYTASRNGPRFQLQRNTVSDPLSRLISSGESTPFPFTVSSKGQWFQARRWS